MITLAGSDFIPISDSSANIRPPGSMWVWSDFSGLPCVNMVPGDAIQAFLSTLCSVWKIWDILTLEVLFWGRACHLFHKPGSRQMENNAGFRGSKVFPSHMRDHTTASRTGVGMGGSHVTSSFGASDSSFHLEVYILSALVSARTWRSSWRRSPERVEGNNVY